MLLAASSKFHASLKYSISPKKYIYGNSNKKKYIPKTKAAIPIGSLSFSPLYPIYTDIKIIKTVYSRPCIM